LSLADKEFFRTFGFISLFIRADPNANERITALLENGYKVVEAEDGYENYYKKEIAVN
jgi:hypothetical protein